MTISPLIRATAALALIFSAGCGAEDTALTTLPQASQSADKTTTDAGKAGGDPGKPGDPNTGCTVPPSPAVKCADSKSEKGEVCTTCYDETGTIVKQSCSTPATNLPPPDKCYEDQSPDGGLCKVCLDPTTGKELSRACSTPTPPIARCEPLDLGGGVQCKICYDASGVPVTKECSP